MRMWSELSIICVNTLQIDCREEVAHPDLLSVDFIDHTVTFCKSDPSR